MTLKKQFLKTLIFILPVFLLLFAGYASVSANSETEGFTNSPTVKVCVLCDEGLPVATATPTPDACGQDCGENAAGTASPASGIVPTSGQVEYQPGVVKGILFWMQGCPHCDEVKANVLPEIAARYGDALQIRQIELETIDEVDLLFIIGTNQGLPVDRIGVPFLMVGDAILIGVDEIAARLPEMVDRYLKEGGAGFPDNPYLARYLPVSTPTPTSISGEACMDCEVFDREIFSITQTSIAVEITQSATQAPVSVDPVVTIYFFWGDGCPHCAKAKPFLQELAAENPNIKVNDYEVWHNPENQLVFIDMAAAYGFEPHGVPTIFICDSYFEGYSDLVQSQIESAVERYRRTGCPNEIAESVMDADKPAASAATPTVLPVAEQPSANQLKGYLLAYAVMIIMIIVLIYALIRIGLAAFREIPSFTIPPWQNRVIPILVLFGLGVAGYLAYVETQTVAAICGPVGDCNAVQSSSYALLFGVLPVGVLGVGGYLAILFVWGCGRFCRDRLADLVPLALFGLTFVGVVFSLYLTYLEPFVIKAVCLWCISSAIIMTLLLLLSVNPMQKFLSGEEEDDFTETLET